MRKIRLLLALAAALALPCAAAPAALPALAAEAEPAEDAAKEGVAGGVKWSLDEGTGVLTIEPADTPEGGKAQGEMLDFRRATNASPWSVHGANIKEVRIGDGVTYIGDHAFFGIVDPNGNHKYPKLTKVTGGRELREIGINAFCECRMLESFEATSALEVIGEKAFYECVGLNTFKEALGLKAIGQNAFRGCNDLSGTFTIGPNVAGIGEIAFAETGISMFKVAEANTKIICPGGESSGDGYNYGVVLYGVSDKTLIACAPKAGESGGSFQVGWLTGVEKIGAYAFYGVSFDGGAENLEIPPGVERIGNYAFAGCEWLKGSLTIPGSVEEIGNYAFAGCSNLSGTLTLGSGLKSIGMSAFGVYGLNRGPRFTCLNWDHLDGDCNTTIGDNAFSTCQFDSLVLPEGVAAVGRDAFLSDASPIVLPKSLVTLDAQSFYVRESTVLYVSNTEQAKVYPSNGRLRLDGGFVDLTDDNKAALENCVLPTPTREGHTFEGWYTAEDLTGEKVEPGAKLADGKTYYAKWAPDPPAPTPTPTPVPPPATETTVTKNPDGSTTTTVRDKGTGKETVTREYKEGVRVVTVKEPGAGPRATVTLPAGVSPFLVTLPVDATEATVAAYAGTREAINRCVPVDGGLAVLVTRSCELVVFDNAKLFSDMSGHWAQGAVDFASARGLMNGIGGTGAFEPDTHTSRAMVCAVLSNLEYGPEATTGLGFADTASDAWYAKAVAWAAEAGIVHGYGDGKTFGPSDDVTREQMACMVYNYARAMGMDTTKRADLSAYADAGDLTFGREAMEWCVASGIFHGYDGGEELGGLDGLTRAQCAAVLMNLVTLIVEG